MVAFNERTLELTRNETLGSVAECDGAGCDQREPSAEKNAFIASEELQHVPSDSHLGEPSKELVSKVSV
eukprot:s7857_g2.t1